MESTVYVAVYHRSSNTAWPDDVGDDPSFVASRTLSQHWRVLTCVVRNVSQVELWRDRKLAVYPQYHNLLRRRYNNTHGR